MNIAGSSVTGPREHNEDCYYYKDFSGVKGFPHGIKAFVMLSDGMGGYQGGDIASQLACEAARSYIESLIEIVESEPVDLDVDYALREMIESANRTILAEMQNRGNQSMGATFVGAFVSPTKAWIAHVGDSRAYRIRRGSAEQLTKDHSLVARMISDGLITEDEAQKHDKRNVVEKALGFNGAEDADLTHADFTRSDMLLLCSDGVSTVLDSNALAEAASMGKTIEGAAELLTSAALKSDTDDNATVVLAVQDWKAFKAKIPKLVLGKRFLSQRAALFIGLFMLVVIAAGVWLAQSNDDSCELDQVENENPATTINASGEGVPGAANQTEGRDEDTSYKWRILEASSESPLRLRFLTNECAEGSLPQEIRDNDNRAITFRPDSQEPLFGTEVNFADENDSKISFIKLDESFWRSSNGDGIPPILINLKGNHGSQWLADLLDEWDVAELFITNNPEHLEKIDYQDAER
ncbi:MAG: protein phosphatase 2C domain-containing protein [Coriobacteriia bacterium]|nr:protein phosphatase 2C domain-containing protein [Coriobacteriia bacterium]